MPLEVLELAAQEMTNWRDCGMGVMEMSHRGREFISIYEQTHQDLKDLLAVPDHFKILFMQGGGIAENAVVPMNLSRGGSVDFVISGSWSQKSFVEAQKYCHAQEAASAESDGFHHLPEPSSWRLNPQASYVHLCTNETIHGVECHDIPDLKALGVDTPLVIDFSSHVLAHPVDWRRVGLAFAGAQKNIGPAGLTLVIVREDLLDQALAICPSAFNYALVAKNDSMFNTPPTYSIYMAGLVMQWLKRQTEDGLSGVLAIQARNQKKAQLLYNAIDQSRFYENRVAKSSRSVMNVPFYLRDESLNERFLQGARAAGLLQLKGHKSVGGMRASIYNAMPLEGVQALVSFMQDFERTAA